jgi:hypothetical protein
MCKKASSDTTEKGSYYSTMVQNIVGNLDKIRILYRLDVNFKISDK